MSEFDHTYKTGTSKQKRKFDGYVPEYNDKRSKIENIRELLRNKKMKMACNCIENYLEKYGEDGYIYHELGKYYNIIGNHEEAIKYFTKVIDNNYKNMYYSLYELAKIERNNFNYSQAIIHLNTIIDSNHPEKCHAKLELAKNYYLIGKYKKAIHILSDLIDNNELNKIYAFDSLIEFAYAYNDKITVNHYYEKMKDKLDSDANLFYNAIINIMGENVIEGKKQLEEINTDKKELKNNIKYYLALANFDLENYYETIEYLQELLSNETKIGYYNFIVNTYSRLKDFDNAFKYVEEMKNKQDCFNDEIELLYGNIYFMKQEYEKALEYYNNVITKNKTSYRDAIYKKICVYIKNNNYEKVLELIEELKKYDVNKKYRYLYDNNSVELLCNKRLGKDISSEGNTYTERQIIKYSKEKTLKHMAFHKEMNKNKTLHSVFNDNVDLEELYNYALLNINEDNFYYNNFMDIYLLDYPNVGIVNDKQVNYIEVITFPNTKQIITIFPYNKSIKEKRKENTKVKQMSRIDKFNKKYNL